MMYLSHQQRLLENLHQYKRAWAWAQLQNLFHALLGSHALDVLWKEHFHVAQPIFEYISNLVRPDLQKQQTRMQTPVTVEEPVGMALWQLATGNSFRSCILQFGLGK